MRTLPFPVPLHAQSSPNYPFSPPSPCGLEEQEWCPLPLPRGPDLSQDPRICWGLDEPPRRSEVNNFPRPSVTLCPFTLGLGLNCELTLEWSWFISNNCSSQTAGESGERDQTAQHMQSTGSYCDPHTGKRVPQIACVDPFPEGSVWLIFAPAESGARLSTEAELGLGGSAGCVSPGQGHLLLSTLRSLISRGIIQIIKCKFLLQSQE